MPSIELSSSSRDSANWCEIRIRYGSYYSFEEIYFTEKSFASIPPNVETTPSPYKTGLKLLSCTQSLVYSLLKCPN